MASALGARLLDADGRELPPGGAALLRLARVDVAGLDFNDGEVELAGLVLGPDRRARPVPVDGEPVVRDGQLLGADLTGLRAELVRRARCLWPE